jgi:hypothetical protein
VSGNGAAVAPSITGPFPLLSQQPAYQLTADFRLASDTGLGGMFSSGLLSGLSPPG